MRQCDGRTPDAGVSEVCIAANRFKSISPWPPDSPKFTDPPLTHFARRTRREASPSIQRSLTRGPPQWSPHPVHGRAAVGRGTRRSPRGRARTGCHPAATDLWTPERPDLAERGGLLQAVRLYLRRRGRGAGGRATERCTGLASCVTRATWPGPCLERLEAWSASAVTALRPGDALRRRQSRWAQAGGGTEGIPRRPWSPSIALDWPAG